MKRSKVILGVILLLCAGFSVFLYVHFKNKEDDVVHKIIGAKTKSYDNLKELESDSSLIVRGIKTSEEEPTIFTDEHGGILAGYTLSKFKISSIEKDGTSNGIQVGDEITVFENEVYNKYENEIHHIAGYTKMIMEKEYLLFLEYAEGNGWYIPCGINFGKIPIDRNEKLSMSQNTSLIEIISTQAYKKYIDQ